MKKRSVPQHHIGLIAWIATVMAVAVTVVRLVLMPTLRDADTGRFTNSFVVIAVMLVTLIAVGVLGWRNDNRRIDIGGRAAMPAGLLILLGGAGMAISSLWSALRWMIDGTVPPPETAKVTALSSVILLLMLAFGVLGGVALLRLGWKIMAEDGTRIGMTSWSVLAPVLYAWFRLARYEMSYASAIGLGESFYDFLLLILEMLFFFKLARFTSGIGKSRPGNLAFYAAGTELFALSGALYRLGAYFLQDPEAYRSSELAGFPDFLIGCMALAVMLGLDHGAYREEGLSKSETDAPVSVDSPTEDLLIVPEDREDGDTSAGNSNQA